MIAIDTNLLIYAHRSATEQHRAARTAIGAACNAPQGWGFCLNNVTEFWSMVTHPSRSGRPSTAAQASAFIQSLISEGDAQVWLPGPDLVDQLMQLAVELKIAGPRIFDLEIALTAFENGAREIWTHDRNFVAIPGLRVVDPLRR